MSVQNKIYITAPELAEMLGISIGHERSEQRAEKRWIYCYIGKSTQRIF